MIYHDAALDACGSKPDFDEMLSEGVGTVVADAMGVTLSNAPNGSLFGYDPIAKLTDSDSSVATKAQTVYTANQQLMALANVAGGSATHIGQRALNAAQSAIQTVLDDNGISATASMSFTDLSALAAEGHSGYMDGLAEHLTLHKPSADAFRLNPGSLELVDYIDGTTSNVHKIYPQVASGTLEGSLVGGTIDLSNLYDLVGTTTAGRSPILRFSLNSIPDAGTTGTATITTRIFDGTDATELW